MIEVYHRIEPTFSDSLDEARAAWPEGFKKVAEVWRKSDRLEVGDRLEVAYRLTNTIDTYWPKRSWGVTAIGEGKFRSTSVGDVLKTPDGKLWLVATLGFERMYGG